jgi:uncharacterized membrane-anchored protein
LVADSAMATAVTVPFIALGIWWITRRLHYKVLKTDKP